MTIILSDKNTVWRNGKRLERALTRAGFIVSVSTRDGKVPVTDQEIKRLREAYERILRHAVELGWISCVEEIMD